MSLISKIKTTHLFLETPVFHFIYLVITREFLKSREQIYKIGKTTQENLARFNSYPNSSVLLFHCICIDCHKIEKIILKIGKTYA